jgi:rare lipoprotein A
MARTGEGWRRSHALIALMGLILAGCASPSPSPVGWSGSPAGRGIGAYRVGAPYQIHGVWYYPAVDYNYDRTGTASWYGEAFEGRLTANGEIFDLNELTAAHTTLPMPSIVQVTNLENGRSLQLRVNDRGPFVGGRLIDVSRRAAQLLGFENQGTTLVRVTILKDESIAAAEEAMHNSGQIMVAEASRANTAAPAMRSPPVYAAAITPTARSTGLAMSPPHPRTAPPQLALARPASPPPREHPLLPPAVAASNPPAVVAASNPPPSASLMTAPAPAVRSRFSLIARAEAAELPPNFAPLRKPQVAAAAAAKTAPSPATLAAGSSAAAGRIFVQAGAFASRDNAERAEARIARLGSVHVTSAAVNGVAMYRVRLGPLASAAQASRLLARVVDSGCRGARIVSD